MNDIDNKALAAGLKKFPEKFVGEKETLFGKVPIDSNTFPRICYIDGFREGYEAAKKDILELLENNVVLHLGHATVDNDTTATDGLIEAKELILTQL